MKKSTFLYLFCLASVVEIMAAGLGWAKVELYAKPMIVLSLMAYYSHAAPSRSATVMLALAFCWMGDVLLMFEGRDSLFLTLGLGSFLVAHLFFIAAYRSHMHAVNDKGKENVQRVRLAFPIMLAGAGLVTILLPALGSLQIPVMVYAAVLTAMVVTAIFRMGRTSSKSFWILFSGALLFMISDSLLAFNKFVHPLAGAGWWIMVSYCLAVYLITRGVLEHVTPKAELVKSK